MVKQTVFQTTGVAGLGFEIEDGTAAGNASVGAASTYNPLAGDNPLLVRAVIGDENAIATLFTMASFPTTDLVPGALNVLPTLSLLAGPSSGGGSNNVRLASVLDGAFTIPAADDNPVFVSQGFKRTGAVQDGGQVNVPDSTDTTIAAANGDRVYFEVKNDTGATIAIALGVAATATDFEIADGASWFMEVPAIFTGAVHCFQTSGGAVNVNVIEF